MHAPDPRAARRHALARPARLLPRLAVVTLAMIGASAMAPARALRAAVPAPARLTAQGSTSSAASLGAPSNAPVLRIEAGRHTGLIKAVDATPDGEAFVSASRDKTIRVWHRDGAELVLDDVFRVPIGAGNEGKLRACAIRPDGGSIVAAGWTGYEWERDYCLYWIDRRAGVLARRTTQLGVPANALAYSADGERLLACLSGSHGIRCYDGDGHELWRDTDYADSAYGVCWLPDGSVVTSCMDGKLRRYDAQGARTHVVETTSGTQPYSLATDGIGELLIGFTDAHQLERRRADDLALISVRPVLGDGKLPTVAWAAERWWASGIFEQDGRMTVFSWWPEQALPRAHAGPATTVTDLCALGDDLLLASADPVLRVMNTEGRVLAGREPVGHDLRGMVHARFLTDDGLRRVAFGRQGYALFDLAGASYGLVDAPPTGLAPPRHALAGVDFQGWQNGREPRVGEHALQLRGGQICRAGALTPNGQRVVLGTDYGLACHTIDGRQLWSRSGPGICWGVQTSADGELIVSAWGDGTLRWHAARDGRELLAFFGHVDGERWVAWTPSGYYDCSPGGEALIGWHVNRGADELADFYSAGRFRRRFYRPAVVQAVLETRDEAAAIAESGLGAGGVDTNALPPVVRLLAPTSGARVSCGTLRLKYSVRSDVDVRELQVLLDGAEAHRARGLIVSGPGGATGSQAGASGGGRSSAPEAGASGAQDSGSNGAAGGSGASAGAAPASGLAASGASIVGPGSVLIGAQGVDFSAAAAKLGIHVRELEVEIPPRLAGRAVTLALIATNAHGSSEPATIALDVAPLEGFGPALVDDLTKPVCYVLAIGVSDYAAEGLDLAFAAKDARDFAAAFEAQRGGLFRDVVARVALDATEDQVGEGLEWLERSCTASDLAVLFLAGHGQLDGRGRYFYLPSDCDPERLRSSAILYTDLLETIDALPGKSLTFLDTCHAGGVTGGTRRRDPASAASLTGLVNELASAEHGSVVFAAATGRQFGLESDAWGNGAFTKALVEALSGEASGVDEPILRAILDSPTLTVNRLNTYVAERVKRLTGGEQTPTMQRPATVPDFPIAVR